MTETFNHNVGTHKNCGGNCISKFTNKVEFELRQNPDCGSITGDSATCDKCGVIIGYDGNFWTE